MEKSLGMLKIISIPKRLENAVKKLIWVFSMGAYGRIQNSNGKAWLEFYEHEMALLALERIGRQEIFHLNDPIEAGA